MLTLFLTDLDLCCVLCWHYFWIDLNLCCVWCWHHYKFLKIIIIIIIFDWSQSMLCLMLTSLFFTDPDLCCVLCWHQSFWLNLNCVVFGVDISIFLLILICVVFYVDIGIFDWSWTVLCLMLTSLFFTDPDLCCVLCWHQYFWLILTCVVFDVDIIFDISMCVLFDVDIIIFDWSQSVFCSMLTSLFLTDLIYQWS